MNNQEAKFILQSYRHNGGDADDPQFREALECAQQDPDLSKWLAEETALDSAVSRKLKAVAVPTDLKAKILALGNIIEPVPWWRSPVFFAAAACFIILVGMTALLLAPQRANNFAQYRDDMTHFLSTKLDHLDMDSPDMAKIRAFLNERGALGDLVVPEKIVELRKLGCRVLEWHGEKVTLVCFKLNGPQEVHLLVANRARFRNPPKEASPQFEKSGDWMTASWSRGNNVYVLAGMGDRASLDRFF